ncbi:MAG: hypothetical protein JWQ81_3278 [Amycolatopsis sp.]|jgi:hypothetical protein|nr:hypothetical protein [Amycolatopsis sp.]
MPAARTRQGRALGVVRKAAFVAFALLCGLAAHAQAVHALVTALGSP